jgi:tetratricopeptide (TPR) repeat protein
MQVTNQRGAAWMAVSAYRDARADFEESLVAAGEVGHVEGQQSNLEWLGKVSAQDGDVASALTRYDESESVIVRAGPAIATQQAVRMRALLALQRARAHLRRGARPEAVTAVARALDHFHATGDERENRAKCLVVLGDALDVRSAAADAYHEAAVLFRADGLRRAEAGALLRVGQHDDDSRRAREALERARDLFAELGDPSEDEARAALARIEDRPT